MRNLLRCSAAVLSALAFACYVDDEPGPVETVYDVAGVRVVVVDDHGPDHVTMTMAAEVYRRAAVTHFSIDTETDQVIWLEVAEIRWPGRSIPPIGGTYDPETREIELEYTGCVVDSPVFRMLAAHYYYELTGETELLRDHVVWAEQLSAANTTILCAP